MPAASRTESSTSTDSNDGPAPALGAELPVSPLLAENRRSHRNRSNAGQPKSAASSSSRMGRGPRPWHRAWWENLFIGATLDDPLVRVQLFRFIDALPALHTDQAVRRHLAEYLAEAGDRVPWWLSLAIELAPPGFDPRSLARRHGPFLGRRDGPKVHRRRHPGGSHPDGRRASDGAGSRSRPTCWARR